MQSITLLAPSFLTARAYERSNKARFLKYLHWIGIGASIVMGFSAGIARGFAYKILGLSPQFSLITGTSSSWMDNVQLIVSGILFMSIVCVEFAFGWRLLICINELTSTKKTAEELEKDLEKAKEGLQVLEKTTHNAYVKVGQIENFDLFSESWKASWVESLVLQYRSFWEKTKERARNNIDNLPPGSIISLAK